MVTDAPESTDIATVQTQPTGLRVTKESVQDRRLELDLLQSMVRGVLKKGIDFGRIPGTPADSLWEPGAMQIISAFNCYPGQRRILQLKDDLDKLVVIVEVPVISRTTQEVMATGVGAASTLETKYKYRWFNEADAKQIGYDDTALAALKQRQGRNDATEYRVPNPEHGELLNTILKMASKRAEVDAAESLPGVSSVLRQVFTEPQHTRNEAKDYTKREPVQDANTQAGTYNFTNFWGDIRKLGIDQTKAHELLDVASVKDWLVTNTGKTLKDALAAVREKLLWEKGETPELPFK
jgi:hypothetical protein